MLDEGIKDLRQGVSEAFRVEYKAYPTVKLFNALVTEKPRTQSEVADVVEYISELKKLPDILI